MQLYEVERKYKITNKAKLLEDLANLGFVLYDSKETETVYFGATESSIKRIVKVKEEKDIDWKRFVLGEKSIPKPGEERVEKEEDVSQFVADFILSISGTSLVVDKTRLEFKNLFGSSVFLNRVNIDIDTAPVYGEFVEIEVLAESQIDVDIAKSIIEHVAKALELGEKEGRSYYQMVLERSINENN